MAAFEGQTLATSPRPEDARLWLIAAAVLGFIGVRLLEVNDSVGSLSLSLCERAGGEGGFPADTPPSPARSSRFNQLPEGEAD
jgi:hypothetical protein